MPHCRQRSHPALRRRSRGDRSRPRSVAGVAGAALLLALLLAAAAPTLADDFGAAFTDPAWDGEKVPDGEQCQRFEGQGRTPEIRVTGIPDGADALVLEFSDTSFQPMDDGGHGKIGYELPEGASEVTVPRAPGHTSELEAPFFVVAEHQAPRWDTAGAYLPPCSGGRGNRYTVTVKAVHREGDELHELASAVLEMGTY